MSLTAAPPYRRDAMTWAVYSGLLAFGFLNAVLGPALPYLRATEHISYLVARSTRWRSRSAAASRG